MDYEVFKMEPNSPIQMLRSSDRRCYFQVFVFYQIMCVSSVLVRMRSSGEGEIKKKSVIFA